MKGKIYVENIYTIIKVLFKTSLKPDQARSKEDSNPQPPVINSDL